MARLFWLSDEAWARIEPHLPHGQPGKPRVDDRRVISGILHVLKIGCRWQDTPSAYGPHTTIYNRYNRWSQRGIWQRLFAKIAAAGPVPDELKRFRNEGQLASKPMGGDHTSKRIEAHAALILATSQEEPRLFLRELRDRLAKQGVQTSTSGLSRFFARHGISWKRMARPVRKWLGSAGLCSLHKRIRPSGEPLAKMEIRASWAS